MTFDTSDSLRSELIWRIVKYTQRYRQPMTNHSLTDRTVLVTGGTGFIGSHLSDVLVVDNRVREAYNIGTGTATTICELASTVKRTVGSDSKIGHTDPRPGDIRHSRADIERARAALGYEPTVSLSDGIAALVNDGPTSLIRDR